MVVYILLFLLAACASFVQRVTGFGFGIFIMMFLPYIMPYYNEAVALSGLLSGTTAFLIIIRKLRYICWRRMFLILLANIAVSYFVIMHMSSAGGDFLRHCLGIALILVALYFIFVEGRLKFSFESRWLQLSLGAISGIMGAMFAMPGPPVVLYGVNVIEDKEKYMATMQAFWLLFNMFYLLFRSSGSYYTSATPQLWLVGLAGLSVGLFFGAKCFNALDRKMFKRAVYLFMIVSGIVALFG